MRATSVQDRIDYLLELCVDTWSRLLDGEELRQPGVTDSNYIVVDTYDHVRIMDIATSAFRYSLPPDHCTWRVHAPTHDQTYPDLPVLEGDQNWLSLHNYGEGCFQSNETMRCGFEEVFKAMRTGWTKSELEDYPDIFHQQDPEHYYLYIKDSHFPDEDTLIRFISNACGIRRHIICYDYWGCKHKEQSHRQVIYMWVEKEVLEKVKGALMFDLS